MEVISQLLATVALSLEKEPPVPLNNRSERFGKILLSLPGIEPLFPRHLAHNLITTPNLPRMKSNMFVNLKQI
jgi:hypothetical protein